MYYHAKHLQYPVKCDNPLVALMLQQAIGDVEGEIRVYMQCFFQAWADRELTTKYSDMLLHTAIEEIGHIEMLATAVALNLGSPRLQFPFEMTSLKSAASQHHHPTYCSPIGLNMALADVAVGTDQDIVLSATTHLAAKPVPVARHGAGPTRG
jgi:Mn-containing catalase